MTLALSAPPLPWRSPALPRLRPALTLASVFGTGSVYCPRPSFTVPGWVPQDPAVLDLVTGRELAIAGDATVVCSDAVTSLEGLRLLADAGLPIGAHFVGSTDFSAMIAGAREGLGRGLFLPLATYHPADGGRPADAPRLLGLVLGTSRADVGRHEEELERCGLH